MADEILHDIMAQRREKLDGLAAAGLNPFHVTSYLRTHQAREILDNFAALEGQTVRVAGRVMSRRGQGKVTFMHLQDVSGRIQAFLRFDDLGEAVYERLKLVDVGDILGVEGYVFRTRTGEISVHVKEFEVLAKALRSLPASHLSASTISKRICTRQPWTEPACRWFR